MTAITSLPYIITSSGHYKLTGNLGSANNNFIAITIAASNVLLDLKGYALSNNGAGTSTISTGIYVNNGYNSINIQNGIIEKFMYGIRIYDSSLTYTNTKAIDIHDLKLYQNTFRAIKADGSGVEIYDNTIIDTGPTTFFSNAFVFGIEVYGKGAVIMDNHIFNTTTTGSGEAVGISASGIGAGSFIINNKIANPVKALQNYGIWIGGEGGVGIDHNYISDFENCLFSSSTPSGYYSNNLAFNCSSKYQINSVTFLDYGNNL